ncbi:MAG TPA: hypothetical protein VFN71_09650 [Methylomirabilota bacterium]|nr:hypothetical protein [Methylomirabilota bacterium]
MRATLILAAVELEARWLARELELVPLRQFRFPAFGRGGVSLATVGLRAGLLAERWAALVGPAEHPLVVSAGLCAGLHPGLRRGDLVVPESVLGPEGQLYNVTASPQRAALARAGARARAGILITTREVLATPEAKAEVYGRTGAVAADMESAVILTHAAAAGCPALVIRAVSDRAADPLPPELVALVTPEGRLRTGRALALTLRRPGTVPRAFALRHATRRGLRNVARALAGLAV